MAFARDASTTGLLCLPVELKFRVLNELASKRDLLNLSLVCHDLEQLVLERLYESVSLELPQSRRSKWDLATLPYHRAQVLRSLRHIQVRSGAMETAKESGYTRPTSANTGSLESYMSNILDQVPPGGLTSFSYLHSSPLPARVVQQLAESQNENLQHLRVYEMEPSTTPRVALPSRLTTFECQSIEDGGLAGRLIRQNKSTIETLKIGQERKLVERYRQSRVELLDPATQVLPNITTTLPLPGMTNLRQLDLSGLDISPLIPENIESAMFLCQLERIALQSCVGSAIFLENLAETFWFAKAADNPNKCVPSLKHFLFRHEALSNQLKQALSQLLASFSTLETLSLLFENALFLERPSNLINNHGPTLKTLVLECRIQPRENLGLDTSRPFGVGGYSQALWQESIGDITRLCPNLEELGMGFPWNDEIVRLRKTDLPVLRRLKTIHIRNFPESQFLSQLGDYTIKEYATKFVEWIFPGLVGGSRPSLELLALGPTLYETRWKTNPVRRQPPEFLRTHYFALDWAKTRFGRWHPLITGVSERYVEEARSEAPPAGVFEQVWLR